MSKRTGIITLIIAAMALCLSLVSIYMITNADHEEGESDIQYVMYLGTNDKDTNEPVFEPAEAREQAKKILIDHFGGYTIQEAKRRQWRRV